MTPQYRSYFAFDNPDGGSGGMPLKEISGIIPGLPDHMVECIGGYCIPTVYFDAAILGNGALLAMKFLGKGKQNIDIMTLGMLGLEIGLLAMRSCIFGCDQD